MLFFFNHLQTQNKSLEVYTVIQQIQIQFQSNNFIGQAAFQVFGHLVSNLQVTLSCLQNCCTKGIQVC